MELLNGPDVKQTHHEKAQGEKEQSEGGGIREKGPGELKRLAIAGQEHSGDELGEEAAQRDSQPQGEQSHEERLAKEQPGGGSLFHAQNGLHGEFLLFLSDHIPVDIPDEKEQEQCDPTDGQLHPLTEKGEIKFRPQSRVVITAGDGEKGIEQPHTQGQGYQIDQVILDGSPGAAEDQLTVHPLCPLPSW